MPNRIWLGAVLSLLTSVSGLGCRAGDARPAETTTEAALSSVVPMTTPPPTTTTGGPTTIAEDSTSTLADRCNAPGGQMAVISEFPERLTSLVGAEIRTGTHECFERIVIELQPGDAPTPSVVPGYRVRYADGPVTLGETDDQFIELAGDADLLITINAWMSTIDAAGTHIGYDGPTDIIPANVTVIKQMYLTNNFEGVHTWAIGLDQRRNFRVSVLSSPVRIVVDIAV